MTQGVQGKRSKKAGPLVVVGVDGSAGSKEALRWAMNYAKTTGAHVRAVIGWHWPISLVVALPVTELVDPLDEALETLNAAVADALGEASAADVEVKAYYGAAVPVLLEAAAHASLLVVGSRGHGGFHGLLLGSTGEHCVRHAPCPVVVVRPEDVQERGAS